MQSHGAHLPDPVRHGVSAWGAVVGVDDNDRDDDRSDDKHHCEQHVFAYQRHCAGGGGNQLHDDQKEHSQRQQDRDAESHFLTCHAKKTPIKTKSPLLLLSSSTESIYWRRRDVDDGYSHKYTCVHLEGCHLSQHPRQ